MFSVWLNRDNNGPLESVVYDTWYPYEKVFILPPRIFFFWYLHELCSHLPIAPLFKDVPAALASHSMQATLGGGEEEAVFVSFRFVRPADD